MADLTFLELIRQICKCPAMFTGGSVKETLAFIDGYRFGNNTPISGRNFDKFVSACNSFPSNVVWTYVITNCAKDDNDALRLIENYITEFIQLKEQMFDKEIIKYAKNKNIKEKKQNKSDNSSK